MNAQELDDTINKFAEEIQLDLKLDQVSAKEKVGLMPSIRHKWVARLIRLKRKAIALEQHRRSIIDSVVANAPKGPVALSPRVLAQKAATQPSIIEIDDSLKHIALLVDYLERVEKITHAMGHDCRNLVDLVKMETL